MTANEPPNPYSPPTSSSSDGRANAPPPAANAAESVRGAATAAALLGFPLGAGFYILGRRRPAVAFASAGILVGALATASIRAPAPKLFLIALGAAVGLWLAAALGTMKARPGPTPVRRAAPWTIVPIALALLINAAVKHWLIEAFQIPAGSMIPTLRVGDHVLVRKGRADITRGDVIVFEFPADRSVDYVKRVVAMGGDTVEVRSGVVSVNGAEIPQAEVKNDPNPCPTEIGEPGCWFARETSGARTYTIMFDEHPAQDHPRTVIPPGEVFVLGDNRNNSYDSRRWGTVPVDHIKGVVTMTWWSRGLGVTDVRWSRVGSAIH